MIFVLRIKKKKEQQRYAEEQRILRMNLPEEPCSEEKMSEMLAQLELAEVEDARQKQQQREKEYQRYSDKFCMKFQMQKRLQEVSVLLSLTRVDSDFSYFWGHRPSPDTCWEQHYVLPVPFPSTKRKSRAPRCRIVLTVTAGGKIRTRARSLSSGSLTMLYFCRYVEALRAQIQEKMSLYNITLPPLCCCGPGFWDANPDTCANNCIFYKNHRGKFLIGMVGAWWQFLKK